MLYELKNGLRLGFFVVVAVFSFTFSNYAIAEVSPQEVTPVKGAPASFSDLAEKLIPTVVAISSKQIKEEDELSMKFQMPPGGEHVEKFFRDFFRNMPSTMQPVEFRGSGFIIDEQGYIVTNHHVVEGADEITVTRSDGSKSDAEFIGSDPISDIALLKIESDDPLPYTSFGKANESRVGEWVMAIGNPFGLGGSVTAGIISARNRDINSGLYDDFIQTDAAINRGNSGGPLFNMDGEVIGVNSFIFSSTGGNVGIAFAVPAEAVKRVVTQLREHGIVRRGWLGVSIQTIDEDTAKALGMEKTQGALVITVQEDSPAEEAGIEKGDVITLFNGSDVQTMRDLPRLVADTPVDSTATISVFRRNKTLELEAKIALRADDESAGFMRLGDKKREKRHLSRSKVVLGMKLTALDDFEGQDNYPEDMEGLVVTSVQPNSPAAKKNIRRGDLIIEAGHESLSEPEDLREAIEEAKEEKKEVLLLLVYSEGRTRFIGIPL